MEVLTTILGYVTSVATTFFTIAGDTVDWVLDHPLALIPIASMLVISGIGVARNLIRGV